MSNYNIYEIKKISAIETLFHTLPIVADDESIRNADHLKTMF